MLFLHGTFGLTPDCYPLIHYLAQHGYIVFVPRYRSEIGRGLAGPITVRTNFFPWLRTLTDALIEITSWPSVDPSRIGILGISLGASLGLVLASRYPGVKAFVHWVGDVPELVVANLAHMPPTLVIHGGSDRHIPVQTVIKLAFSLKRLHVPCELRTYPGQRHFLRPMVDIDAARRTIAFLGRYL